MLEVDEETLNNQETTENRAIRQNGNSQARDKCERHFGDSSIIASKKPFISNPILRQI